MANLVWLKENNKSLQSPELKWVEDAADIDFEGLKKYTSLLHVFFKNKHIIQVIPIEYYTEN